MGSDYDSFDDDVADEVLMALDKPATSGLHSREQEQQRDISNATPHTSTDLELEDFGSDAFDYSPERERAKPIQTARNQARTFQQTTLLGRIASQAPEPLGTQPRNSRVFRADLPPEVPTHHALDPEALKTWVYPTNLGPIRDYQFSIVKNGLFNNTLVALPTGLGKTFIAATVILNFFRWTRNAQMVFVAPTKPLASQQVEACLNIAGIPRSQSTLLTGETKPVLREAEWEGKRLFFMTPQTLMNDLSKGYADPKRIVLLVVDEAHRATGDYAYVKVIEFIRRFSKSFRVLALTATPGSTVEGVQDVIDNLGVSHVEIRTEESIDIRNYVHSREIDRVVLEPSDEMLRISELFSQALKPLHSKISQQNIYIGRDPMSITTFGLLKARQDWMKGPGRFANQGLKMMLMAIFTILQSLAHAIKLLNYHGIRPFYDNLVAFRSETEDKGQKGSKYKRQLIGEQSFQEMMDLASKWLKIDGFAGHPKLTHLCDNLLNHFMDAGEGSSTRVIVFSEYRDSAEEITRVLNVHKPMISASLFVGQADSKKSEGMKQKQQIETIAKFRDGIFNVLVATSIGEEGLDIGQVDLIICYDASSSPIRMLQRMGRTGRKRAGKITLLLMKGKEEDNYAKAQDNYEKMQKLICEGSRFNFRHDLSSRIVPRDVKPEVDKRMVEIPIENTQDTSLPEPKARSTRGKKASKKKFNMPDGVETGFNSVASMLGISASKTKAKPNKSPKKAEFKETDEISPVPPLEGVLLSVNELAELNKKYRDLPFFHQDTEEICMPSLTARPDLQRVLRPTVHVKHGSYTKRCVRLFKKLSHSQGIETRHTKPHGDTDKSRYLDISVPPFAEDSGEDVVVVPSGRKRSLSPSSAASPPPPGRKRKANTTAAPRSKRQSVVDEYASESEDDTAAARQRKTNAAASPESKRQSVLDEYASESDAEAVTQASEDEESVGSLADFISDGEANGNFPKDMTGFTSDEDDDYRSGSLAKSSLSGPLSGRQVHRSSGAASKSGSTASTAAKPFFVPASLPGTQQTDDDEDMPDIGILVGKKQPETRVRKPAKKSNAVFLSSDDDDDDNDDEDDVQPGPAKRTVRRRVIEDSESG
ncbi:3'-5' DNA helicase [Pyricularia oryzae]